MSTRSSLPLAPDEVATYRRDGLLSPTDFRISEGAQNRLRVATDRMIERNDDPDLILVAHLPKRPGVVGGIEGGEEIFKVALEPSILDVVEQLIGPNILLWGSSLWAKPAGIGKEVQWHQEANYWPMRPLETVSIWIAIDEATSENGCMRFVPSSHLDGLLPHSQGSDSSGVLRVRIDPDLVDGFDSRDVPVPAGGIAALDTWVVHGSNANRSDRRRAAVTLRYMPASCHFVRDSADFGTSDENTTVWSVRPMWLVRGENRHPTNDFSIGHENLEDLDQLAELSRKSTGRP